ncbi:MAG: DNA-directed RNA polymerase subunit D [Candidatus Altiarchaeota archaeon]|nr:DNA-directed RNA polymerase subunit D [Candidatus Altiarchaeota archaeon]
MKIKNVTHDKNRISFNIKDVDVPMLNALRRTVVSEIPVMAIESITYTTNTSIMGDELLSHRIGLVPLKTDQKMFNNIADCTCKGKGCGKCTVKLTLKADGPKTVYSGELTPADGETSPVFDTIPLIKLTQSQHLDFEATAQLGIGKDHAKWQAGVAAYEEKDDGSYDVFIESYGQLPLKNLIESAFNTFQSKIEQLKEELK